MNCCKLELCCELLKYRDKNQNQDGTFVMAHQHEAPIANNEPLTWMTWFTLPGIKPATLWILPH